MFLINLYVKNTFKLNGLL